MEREEILMRENNKKMLLRGRPGARSLHHPTSRVGGWRVMSKKREKVEADNISLESYLLYMKDKRNICPLLQILIITSR